MKPSSNAVRLDPRRLEQLKAISQKLGLSSAATVSHMIREKIDAGLIPADIPGIVITKTTEGIDIQIDKDPVRTLSTEGAHRLVAAIRGILDGTEAASIINLDFGFSVIKQGTGFKLAIPFASPSITFPADLIHDLADQIEKTTA